MLAVCDNDLTKGQEKYTLTNEAEDTEVNGSSIYNQQIVCRKFQNAKRVLWLNPK